MHLSLTSILILFQLAAQAHVSAPQSCHKILSAPPAESTSLRPQGPLSRVRSRTALHHQLGTKKTDYFQATSGREIAYDFIPPQSPQHPTLIMIHGLGDYRQKLQTFAIKGVQDGLGLLRMDLNGHGETLKQTLVKGNLPHSHDHHYNSNIEDIFALLLYTGVKKIILAGHSYGGGLSYKLGEIITTHQNAHGLELQLIVMMAPYVQRIDKYWESVTLNPLQSTLENWGMPRAYQGFFMNFLGTQQIRDFLQDPVLDSVFHTQFRQYFSRKIEAEKRRQLTREENEFVEHQAHAANMTMKQARDLDYLNPFIPLPTVDAPLILVGSLYDEIVPLSQLHQFELRLKNEGKRVIFKMLKDDDFRHSFPQTHGEEIYDQTIGEFLRNQRLKN